MKKNKMLFVLLTLMCILLPTTANAASGYEGRACYRDNVAIIEWHAALHNQSTKTGTVIQAPGGDTVVGVYSWLSFVGNGTYMGSYYKSGMQSSQFDNVMLIARKLANKGTITYSLYSMLDHNSTSTYIYTDNVKKMRCDGVVEYAYEYYGFKLQDVYIESPSAIRYYWDISKVSDCGAHNLLNFFTPKNQSKKMTKY